MGTLHQGILSVNINVQSMPHIKHLVLIGAPVEKVYTAITSQQGLASWWTPGAVAKPEQDSIAHFPFGQHYYKEMKITNLKPLELVQWNCIKGADEWVGTTISFKLVGGQLGSLLHSFPAIGGQVEQLQPGEGTLLFFNHDNWTDYTAMFAECSYTWARFLRGLKLLCETGKGLPWPNQHVTN
jgi:uncharacterized protein YndB with AHSA1/START domain